GFPRTPNPGEFRERFPSLVRRYARGPRLAAHPETHTVPRVGAREQNALRRAACPIGACPMPEASKPPDMVTADNILRELRETPIAFADLFAPEREEALHHHADAEWSAVAIVCHMADHDRFERTQRFEAVLSEE